MYLITCLTVGGYGTADIKLLNFVVQVIVQGVCVCLCVYMCEYDLYVGGYGTTGIKLFLLLLRLYCRSKRNSKTSKGE